MKSVRALFILILLAGIADGQRWSRPASTPGDFSYYMLVLSYAPDYCAQPQGQKDPRECGSGRKVSFVVHGLWPQAEDSRGPALRPRQAGFAGHRTDDAVIYPGTRSDPA